MDTEDLAKAVLFRIGQVSALNGVPTANDGRALISKSMGLFINDLLMLLGWLENDTTQNNYKDFLKILLSEYDKGYYSISASDRKAAQAKFAQEDDLDTAAAQRVIDLIQKNFPGSIIVPL